MKRFFVFLTVMFFVSATKAQIVKGQLKHHANQSITLLGFDYYNSYEISRTTIDSLGQFSLAYPASYKGIGLLETEDDSSLVLILGEEPIVTIEGTHIKEIENLKYKDSPQNAQLEAFAKRSMQRNQAYKAWRYLKPLYLNQEKEQHKVFQMISNEIERIEQADDKEIQKLSGDYLRWFVTQRKLVNDMPATAYNYTERIPQNIKQFRNTDFKNPKFKTSGLFRELIEGHYMLLENMGQSIDSMFVQMNMSTDYLIQNLKGEDVLLNDLSEKLFNYLEKRSLFQASEHLALAMLNEESCTVDDKRTNLFEQYRKMAVGKTAPNITLNNTKSLYDLSSNYKLVVFGASWCPYCQEEYPKLLQEYPELTKNNKLEVVYISLDSDSVAFENFYKEAPFYTYCDAKGWKSQAVIDYYVFATPTLFLLDKNNIIVSKPTSIAHAKVLLERL